MPSFEIIRAAPFSIRYSNPNLASQVRVALAKMAWKTGSNSPVELEITCNTSEVAVCCSSDSARSSSASASSRVRASSCFFNSISELGPLLTRALAFVLVERSLRPRVGRFAPLRDKITSSAQSLVPLPVGPALPILTAPHDELAALDLLRSFDHLVSARKQRRRNSKPNSSRAPQVDNELESSGLFDGKVARLRPLDDLVDVIRGAAEQVSCVHAVAHKASILHIVRCVVDRRDAAFCGDFCYSCSIG